VTDEFTREALATNAARRITAVGPMAVLDQIRELRGAPQFLRMDNGPEFIADTLRDWCKEQNIQANCCDPGSPWQNGRIESFNSRLRDELLIREVFDSMWEIRFMLEEHLNNYNHYRTHSALSYLTPSKYATKWWAENNVLAS
jgi:putative transposase